MTIYSPDALLSQFGTSLLFHVWLLLLFDLHTGFSGGRSGGLVFPPFSEFSTVCCDPHKDFSIVNEAEVDVFLEFSCFFYESMDVINLISGSSAFSKSSLNIWNFSVYVLLKSSLQNFEPYFASMWKEYNCEVGWTFFGAAFLRDWNENWPFPACGHCWLFQTCWHIEFSTLPASSFRIWNSWAGIPSPPLALFTVMLPKAHLTLHSKVSRSRWVITPSWLSGSLRSGRRQGCPATHCFSALSLKP